MISELPDCDSVFMSFFDRWYTPEDRKRKGYPATRPDVINADGLMWLYDWPYWESSIYDPQTGQLFPVFHWAIKKFSCYGINDGFKDKLLMCSQMIEDDRTV